MLILLVVYIFRVCTCLFPNTTESTDWYIVAMIGNCHFTFFRMLQLYIGSNIVNHIPAVFTQNLEYLSRSHIALFAYIIAKQYCFVN